MSKEAEARVRDELLQALYASVLRCTLSEAQWGLGARGLGEASMALAAAMSPVLRPPDMVMLPARGAAAFRALRGLGPRAERRLPARDLAAGILPCPAEEAVAASLALGAAAAAARAGSGALVCVLLPAAVAGRLQGVPPAATGSGAKGGKGSWIEDCSTWQDAAAWAARLALPLLLMTDTARPRRGFAPGRPPELAPAPMYPSIPVDRADALAIYRVAFECAGRAREGAGPSHIQCVPFRLRGQQPGEEEALPRLEAMLRKRGAFHKGWRRQLERQQIRELAANPAEPG